MPPRGARLVRHRPPPPRSWRDPLEIATIFGTRRCGPHERGAASERDWDPCPPELGSDEHGDELGRSPVTTSCQRDRALADDCEVAPRLLGRSLRWRSK